MRLRSIRIPRFRDIAPEVFSIASGILLALAYPPTGTSSLAWFALVPFFAAIAFATPRRGFRIGFLAGLAFWLPSIAWMWALKDNGGPWFLVILGHFALSAYCALYFALFGMLLADGQAETPETPDAQSSSWRGIPRALFAAAVWTGLEWVRSNLLTGFAWNHLGVSQYRALPLLQLASLGGVYALSFLVALLNAAIANVVVRILRSARRQPAPRHHLDLAAAIAALIAAIVWGHREQTRWSVLERTAPPFAVAGVQPDAPSVFERGRSTVEESLNRLADRTLVAARLAPDLVVWPESVLMGVVPGDRDAMNYAFTAARACKAPVLAGAVEVRAEGGKFGRELVANASWLFGTDRKVHGMYRKQHLVPFGEYIPLDGTIPLLARLSPVGYSCTPGDKPGLFEVRAGILDSIVTVSPLICFEDTVAPLASRAVREGATLLVNQTNDSWFEGSCEPVQHHAQAVFRAVENRTPLVRVANAGVSGLVFASGRQTLPSAYFRDSSYPRQTDWPTSLYTRHGDWLLAIPCSVIALARAIWLVFRARRTRRSLLTQPTLP